MMFDAEVFGVVAGATWRRDGGGGPAPIPTDEDLASWHRECPAAVRDEANRRLAVVLGKGAFWSIAEPRPGPRPFGIDARLFGVAAGVPVPLGEIHDRWFQLPAAARPAHPLGPIISAWQQRPRMVEPETRHDRRILPRITAGMPLPERQRGMLFGGLVDGRDLSAQRELPLFPEVAAAKRVPLLDLVDAAGVPVRAHRGGAALEARLFVRTMASVRPADRGLTTSRIAVTLRELKNGLFPNRWTRARDWPRLRRALMTARDYAIHDGRGRWWPIALRFLPDEPALDEMIVMDVAFPPGSASGPPVDLPLLDALSVRSSARWRAYIAANSLLWRPGRTRVKAPKAAGRFLWTRNVTRYPVLSADDRRRLAFGLADAKHRTRKAIDDPWRDLPGLVVVDECAVDPQTGEVGWRLMPAAAVPNDTSGESGDTSGE